MSKQQRDYTTEYAKKVVSGELLASKKNVQSCENDIYETLIIKLSSIISM
jgi:hypothetical protein